MWRRAACQAVTSRLFRRAVAASTASSSSALRENCRTGVIIGNPKQGMMDPIHVSWTDIAGSDTTPGARLAAGRVLSMLDMCAARTSQKAVDHQACLTHERYLTCTVGVTDTIFSSPILHGDAVRLDSRLVHCGSSSMGIYIRFYRQSPSTRTETPAGHSFFTMVAITPDLKAAKVVPAIELTDPFDIELHNHYVKVRKLQEENKKNTAERLKRTLTTEEVQCSINQQKPTHARINSTKVEANRIFFTSCMNNNNTVFGGELMAWMEQHAVHCGRTFTANRHVFTIGMHSVAFPEPVFATDWVTLEATVIYVRNTTMEVDVVLKAERKDTSTVITNRASFVLINNDDIGRKCTIPVGLELNGATQEELQQFMEARVRYRCSVARRDDLHASNLCTGMTKL
ncbi:Thioesterase family protein [Leishmania donovani]|nr:Thioesterase family protein [Leishmania donovani]TPP52807.1 Thioesterase family protein [Leishmania donovani]